MKSRFSKPVLVLILIGSLMVVILNSYLGLKYNTEKEGFFGGVKKPAPKERKMYIGATFNNTTACKMTAKDQKALFSSSVCGSTMEKDAQSLCNDLTAAGKDTGISCVGLNQLSVDAKKLQFYPVANVPINCIGPQNQNYIQALKGIPMKTKIYKDPQTEEENKHGIYNCDAPEYKKYESCCNVINTLNSPNFYNNSVSDSRNPMDNTSSYNLDEPSADWATSKISGIPSDFLGKSDNMYSVPYKAPSNEGGGITGIKGIP